MKFLSALHNVQLGDSRMKRITSILLAGALVSVTIGVLSLNPENVIAQPENSPWPMFRGDARHTGRSPYDTSHVDGTVKWSFETGDGIESSPAIGSDGTVYVGSWDNNLYAINPDGTEKWHFTTGGLVRSSPAIGADGTIYVGSAEDSVVNGINYHGTCVLYAVNPDGTQKWRFVTGGDIWGVFCSPAIGSDGTIYYGSGDYNLSRGGGTRLYAFNPNGTEKWSFDAGNDVTSSPAVGLDGIIYVGSGSGNLHAINPNGTEKWHFTTGSFVESSPTIGMDGTIYVGSSDDRLYAVNPNGTEKWRFTTGGPEVFSSPAIGSDGTIYVGTGEGSSDNNLHAINPDGTEKWRFTTGGGVMSSPAIGADGTIYVGSFDGNFYAVNPDGTEKWHLSISASVSSPAIGSDGTIYVGSWDHKLYAIGGPTAPENLPADNDNDGMPDNWESQYELDPNTDDASQDKDGDGYTNLQEYQAGTNPSLASSYPGAGEGGVTPPAEGIPIIYVIVGVAAIVIAAGVVLVFRR